jgi:hypothetical protein
MKKIQPGRVGNLPTIPCVSPLDVSRWGMVAEGRAGFCHHDGYRPLPLFYIDFSKEPSVPGESGRTAAISGAP